MSMGLKKKKKENDPIPYPTVMLYFDLKNQIGTLFCTSGGGGNQ